MLQFASQSNRVQCFLLSFDDCRAAEATRGSPQILQLPGTAPVEPPTESICTREMSPTQPDGGYTAPRLTAQVPFCFVKTAYRTASVQRLTRVLGQLSGTIRRAVGRRHPPSRRAAHLADWSPAARNSPHSTQKSQVAFDNLLPPLTAARSSKGIMPCGELSVGSPRVALVASFRRRHPSEQASYPRTPSRQLATDTHMARRGGHGIISEDRVVRLHRFVHKNASFFRVKDSGQQHPTSCEYARWPSHLRSSMLWSIAPSTRCRYTVETMATKD